MMITMASDNITSALSNWTAEGVSTPDLAMPTLYRDLLKRALNSESALVAVTEMVQMLQGRLTLSYKNVMCSLNIFILASMNHIPLFEHFVLGLAHQTMKRCDRGGKPGDAPSKEEFCMAYRAKKLADQFKCPLRMELKGHLNNEEIGMEHRQIIKENIRYLESGKRCGMRKDNNNIPIIWRKHMGNIVKGSFCEMDGEWYWSKVATCGGKMEEDGMGAIGK